MEALAEQAYRALRSRDGEQAQELLEGAISLEPDSPSLHNNLALAFELHGKVEKAHLMQRKRLHYTEFEALCAAQLDVWLAEKNKEAARTWFDLWQQADPENPDLDRYRVRVGKPLQQSRLLDRLSRKSNR